MSEALTLYSYWRSSAAYRVRIGLNLKGLDYRIEPVHLVRDGGQQRTESYRALNPQQLVPTLLHGSRRITQSLAILEYIDECWPKPGLLPVDVRGRARVRALSQLVASDIHPLNNLRVLQYLKRELGAEQPAVDDWARHWMREGFAAMQAMLSESTETGAFCAQEGMRIFGGYSYSVEYEIERFHRDAMLMCIGEGTNEMQRIIISKQLVARNRI